MKSQNKQIILFTNKNKQKYPPKKLLAVIVAPNDKHVNYKE